MYAPPAALPPHLDLGQLGQTVFGQVEPWFLLEGISAQSALEKEVPLVYRSAGEELWRYPSYSGCSCDSPNPPALLDCCLVPVPVTWFSSPHRSWRSQPLQTGSSSSSVRVPSCIENGSPLSTPSASSPGSSLTRLSHFTVEVDRDTSTLDILVSGGLLAAVL